MLSRKAFYTRTWKPTAEEVMAAYGLIDLFSVRTVGTLRSGRNRIGVAFKILTPTHEGGGSWGGVGGRGGTGGHHTHGNPCSHVSTIRAFRSAESESAII